MNCCRFRFSTCSFSYLYILFTIILFFLKSCILSFSELSYKNKKNIFGIEPVLIKHGLMKLLIEYLGYIIFGGLFFYIFRIRNLVKSKNKKKENNTKITQVAIKEKYFSFRTFKILLIACCLFAIQLIIRNIMNLLNLWMLDLWIFNIIFISFFMKIILKVQIYKHQLFSLGINFCINFVLLIVASSIKEEDGISQFSTIANKFGNYFYIILFYLVFLALSAMICLSQVMQKKLMDVEDESPFTILFIIGIISAFFTIIALIITTYVKCNSILQEKEFCTGNAGYFDSFKILKDNLGDKYENNKSAFFIEILLVYPLYSLACYLKYYCETMIIYHFNPNYVLISDNIYYCVKTLIGIINKQSQKGSILILIGAIISLFVYCFYLEIIELKCCNMNFNTRIRIDERSRSESISIDFNKIDENNDDDTPNVDNNNYNQKEMIYIKEEEKNRLSYDNYNVYI